MNAPSPVTGFARPRHLVVLGHPDPASFCAAVARTYCDTVRASGQEAELRDLYALGFDPRLAAAERLRDERFVPAEDVREEIGRLQGADVITLVYPIWFGMPPAIIKGYIDRVLGAGFGPAELKEGSPHPLLAGKRLALFTSSASTRPWLEERGQWRALRQAFDTYLQNIFALRDAGHTHFDAVVTGAKPGYVEECLAVVEERARAISAELLREKRAAQSLATRRGIPA